MFAAAANASYLIQALAEAHTHLVGGDQSASQVHLYGQAVP